MASESAKSNIPLELWLGFKSIISREGNWDEQGEERGKRENSRQEERCGALLARGDEKGKRDVNERRKREKGKESAL